MITRFLLWMLAIAHMFVGTVGASSLSHDPLNAPCHAHVADDANHAHAHSHGEDEADQASGNHAHGHDATDHSHDKPNVSPLHLTRALAWSSPLNASDGRRDYLSPCSLPERPPRTLPVS